MTQNISITSTAFVIKYSIKRSTGLGGSKNSPGSVYLYFYMSDAGRPSQGKTYYVCVLEADAEELQLFTKFEYKREKQNIDYTYPAPFMDAKCCRL